MITKTLESKGASAYGLVALIATLDDISLNASKIALVLAVGPPDSGTQARLLSILSTGDAVNDISELLMHAALRFIKVEEDLIGKLLPDK
jgi:hypothetical protein